MYCTVALLSPPFASLTYAVPLWLQSFDWKPGIRVVVPLGKGRLRVGVVLGEETNPIPENITVRAMVWPLEREPLLPPGHLELVRQLALRQAVTQGQILTTILPSGLRLASLRLRGSGGARGVQTFFLRELDTLTPDTLQHLGVQWMSGDATLLLPREDAAASELCLLCCTPPWPVRPTASRQMAVLDFLLDQGRISRREVLRQLGPEARPALESLLKNGLVVLEHAAPGSEPGLCSEDSLLPPPSPSFTLSAPQADALQRLSTALQAGEPSTHVLFGVTGSGKTAVYLELIRTCLAQGKSAFLLAPEVALALKLMRDVRLALPDLPAVLFHGYQSPTERETTFRQLAARRSPCIVVGTRSALFLPADTIGLIILDEEHDTSFKQDEGVHYQAKELAWFRIAQSKGILLLGSATPDIKTFHAALGGTIALLRLPERVGQGTLPAVRLVDIGTTNMSESLLAPESLQALRETVEQGEQAVILLNRRGYAPLMYCQDCHKVVRCPNCDIGLTYHKGRERLVCHYCGYTLPFPSPCPSCKGVHYYPMGQGTERVEEFLSAQLPNGCRVLRLDRDSTRRPGSMEAILSAFARQEAQVLVGTQMLSKGHHFPHVTLVIVADADLGLNLPDYRAAERTFQLLVQSSGRAGRGEKKGQVIIQTRDVNHPCWAFVQTGDYESFYKQEIALREKRRYPPFVNLALLKISYPVEWADGPTAVSRITSTLRAEGRGLGVTVLGPAPAPLPLLRGRRRVHCLFKSASWQAIRALYGKVLPLAAPPNLRLSLDIDPVNML